MRLKSKDARAAIIQKLAADFNLTQVIAEAYFSQFSLYFQEHANVSLSTGQTVYEAVAAHEPAGKHIRLTRKVTVRGKLIDFNSDLEALANYGLAGLRRHRLARITKEAYDQNALFSYEDLAMILTTSPSTIRRDVQHLRRQGQFIMTRGAKHDRGPGLSHKIIIKDILELIDNFFLVSSLNDDLHHINYGQLVWMAVPTNEYPGRGKTLAATRMKPVVLSFITDDDIAHTAHGFDSMTLRKKRLERWVDEAFDQGALLTQLDLAALLGVCDAVVSKYVCEIQKEDKLLPTRGNIHDLSGAITHKREIITLYLEGYLTPEIAVKTKHSKEAVDRYIRDYHRVEILWKHGITDLDKISQLTRLSKRVMHQYVDLLPDKLKKHLTKNNKLDSQKDSTKFNLSGETEVGAAEEQPARDSRTEGNDREDIS